MDRRLIEGVGLTVFSAVCRGVLEAAPTKERSLIHVVAILAEACAHTMRMADLQVEGADGAWVREALEHQIDAAYARLRREVC